MKTLAIIIFALPHLILAAETNSLNIVTGVPPHAWMASQLAPEGAASSSIVMPGTDPHTYEPTPKQIAAIYKADIIIASGVPFEERIHEKLPVEVRNRILSLEEDAHEAHHEGHTDLPHSWLSPGALAEQAQTIAERLIQIRPEQQKSIARNLTQLEGDIEALQTRLGKILANARGKRVYVFHPSLDALAKEYHFEQIAIEHEGKHPSPSRLRQIIKQAKTDNADIILANPQFDKRSAFMIAEAVGAEVIEFDPLALNPIENIERIANIIAGKRKP